jgi:hypothetical protein
MAEMPVIDLRLAGAAPEESARRVPAAGLLPRVGPRRARGAPGRDEGRRARALRPPRRRQAPQRRHHRRQRVHRAQPGQPAVRGVRAPRRRRARRRRGLLRAPRRAAQRQVTRMKIASRQLSIRFPREGTGGITRDLSGGAGRP